MTNTKKKFNILNLLLLIVGCLIAFFAGSALAIVKILLGGI
jgi:hypothetical protein